MAHFAEIDSNNKVVRVIVIPNDQEHRGQEYCAVDLNLGGTWLQTSYNSIHGKRYIQLDSNERKLSEDPAFRKNFAGIGYTYNSQLDAFIPPQPFPSWTLDESIGDWKPPVPRPIEEQPQEVKTLKSYSWNEATQSWDKNPEA